MTIHPASLLKVAEEMIRQRTELLAAFPHEFKLPLNRALPGPNEVWCPDNRSEILAEFDADRVRIAFSKITGGGMSAWFAKEEDRTYALLKWSGT